ncbi:hypothetical protein WG66_011877 [Moniliophthora roreri]|nr:hypothetical protein WG66_011877 [Moniliophthora roreri]
MLMTERPNRTLGSDMKRSVSGKDTSGRSISRSWRPPSCNQERVFALVEWSSAKSSEFIILLPLCLALKDPENSFKSLRFTSRPQKLGPPILNNFIHPRYYGEPHEQTLTGFTPDSSPASPRWPPLEWFAFDGKPQFVRH